MPRLLGVDIPNEKRIEIALQYIYGVGAHLGRLYGLTADEAQGQENGTGHGSSL